MTPDEAVRHDWLQPSPQTSYSHSKSMREGQENAENQMISPKAQHQKYQRSQHLTPNTVLPDIKTPSSKYNQKTHKEKTKSNFISSFIRIICQLIEPACNVHLNLQLTGLALSANDLESAQQYSIHRLYPSRKLSTTSTIGGAAVNIKFANQPSGMSHSQSTGDVTSMFGRA